MSRPDKHIVIDEKTESISLDMPLTEWKNLIEYIRDLNAQGIAGFHHSELDRRIYHKETKASYRWINSYKNLKYVVLWRSNSSLNLSGHEDLLSVVKLLNEGAEDTKEPESIWFNDNKIEWSKEEFRIITIEDNKFRFKWDIHEGYILEE